MDTQTLTLKEVHEMLKSFTNGSLTAQKVQPTTTETPPNPVLYAQTQCNPDLSQSSFANSSKQIPDPFRSIVNPHVSFPPYISQTPYSTFRARKDRHPPRANLSRLPPQDTTDVSCLIPQLPTASPPTPTRFTATGPIIRTISSFPSKPTSVPHVDTGVHTPPRSREQRPHSASPRAPKDIHFPQPRSSPHTPSPLSSSPEPPSVFSSPARAPLPHTASPRTFLTQPRTGTRTPRETPAHTTCAASHGFSPVRREGAAEHARGAAVGTGSEAGAGVPRNTRERLAAELRARGSLRYATDATDVAPSATARAASGDGPAHVSESISAAQVASAAAQPPSSRAAASVAAVDAHVPPTTGRPPSLRRRPHARAPPSLAARLVATQPTNTPSAPPSSASASVSAHATRAGWVEDADSNSSATDTMDIPADKSRASCGRALDRSPAHAQAPAQRHTAAAPMPPAVSTTDHPSPLVLLRLSAEAPQPEVAMGGGSSSNSNGGISGNPNGNGRGGVTKNVFLSSTMHPPTLPVNTFHPQHRSTNNTFSHTTSLTGGAATPESPTAPLWAMHVRPSTALARAACPPAYAHDATGASECARALSTPQPHQAHQHPYASPAVTHASHALRGSHAPYTSMAHSSSLAHVAAGARPTSQDVLLAQMGASLPSPLTNGAPLAGTTAGVARPASRTGIYPLPSSYLPSTPYPAPQPSLAPAMPGTTALHPPQPPTVLQPLPPHLTGYVPSATAPVPSPTRIRDASLPPLPVPTVPSGTPEDHGDHVRAHETPQSLAPLVRMADPSLLLTAALRPPGDSLRALGLLQPSDTRAAGTDMTAVGTALSSAQLLAPHTRVDASALPSVRVLAGTAIRGSPRAQAQTGASPAGVTRALRPPGGSAIGELAPTQPSHGDSTQSGSIADAVVALTAAVQAALGNRNEEEAPESPHKEVPGGRATGATAEAAEEELTSTPPPPIDPLAAVAALFQRVRHERARCEAWGEGADAGPKDAVGNATEAAAQAAGARGTTGTAEVAVDRPTLDEAHNTGVLLAVRDVDHLPDVVQRGRSFAVHEWAPQEDAPAPYPHGTRLLTAYPDAAPGANPQMRQVLRRQAHLREAGNMLSSLDEELSRLQLTAANLFQELARDGRVVEGAADAMVEAQKHRLLRELETLERGRVGYEAMRVAEARDGVRAVEARAIAEIETQVEAYVSAVADPQLRRVKAQAMRARLLRALSLGPNAPVSPRAEPPQPDYGIARDAAYASARPLPSPASRAPASPPSPSLHSPPHLVRFSPLKLVRRFTPEPVPTPPAAAPAPAVPPRRTETRIPRYLQPTTSTASRAAVGAATSVPRPASAAISARARAAAAQPRTPVRPQRFTSSFAPSVKRGTDAPVSATKRLPPREAPEPWELDADLPRCLAALQEADELLAGYSVLTGLPDDAEGA